jgi:hypothetical protein
MFIPDPIFFLPDLGSRFKELKYFKPKKMLIALGNMIGMFTRIPDLDCFPIPDPGSRDPKGTGSQIHNTGDSADKKAYFL